MEIAAAPQPSSVCFTYGTSSQIPAFSWGAVRTAGPRKSSRNRPKAILFKRIRNNSKLSLAERERQDDDGERDQNDPQQIAIGNPSSGKITLRLARPLGQFGQVFIA
jgi:hypothetical protein